MFNDTLSTLLWGLTALAGANLLRTLSRNKKSDAAAFEVACKSFYDNAEKLFQIEAPLPVEVVRIIQGAGNILASKKHIRSFVRMTADRKPSNVGNGVDWSEVIDRLSDDQKDRFITAIGSFTEATVYSTSRYQKEILRAVYDEAKSRPKVKFATTEAKISTRNLERMFLQVA